MLYIFVGEHFFTSKPLAEAFRIEQRHLCAESLLALWGRAFMVHGFQHGLHVLPEWRARWNLMLCFFIRVMISCMCP